MPAVRGTQGRPASRLTRHPDGAREAPAVLLYLLALADGAKLARRLIYVVDRRAIVDQTATAIRRWTELIAAIPALDEPGTSAILNILRARILEIAEFDRTQVMVKLGTGPVAESRLFARITRRSCDLPHLAPGREVYAQVNAVSLVD